VLDFYPTLEHEGKIHGLLVAAVSETVEALIATLGKARLRVDVVDLAPLGLARAAQRLAPDDCVAMLHLGDHTSYVVVTELGVPRFVRIIPATLPTAAVRARSAAPVEATPAPVEAPVRELALVGAGGGSPEDAAALPTLRGRAAARHGAMDPAVADMMSRVRDTIAFYDARPGTERSVSAVLVSGAGAGAPGMTEALDAALDVPVRSIAANDLVGSAAHAAPQGDLARNLVPTIGVILGEVPGWGRA
jgi:Tfp pilus assembly PilM family ATPase